ncbi:MAG: hypothetical protein IJC25_04510, partial [Clostridia bacterium]|nr:hypothetical protein [Clostridia bacterium]
FKTRVLKNLYGCSRRQTYSFFLGAVLWGEIGQILSCDAPTVVLGGRSQIRNAMALLLQQSGKRVIVLDDETVERSTALGAVRIYEYGEER